MINDILNFQSDKKIVSLRDVFVVLVLIFALTHFWLLLSFDAVYWDDWGLLNSDAPAIRRMFQFTGLELLGSLHVWFSPLGVGAYKILTLFCIALTPLLVFLIVRHYGADAVQAGCITGLFIVAPLYTAKVAVINVPGTTFATVFFIAWALLLRDLNRPRLLQRLVTLALFSVAFYFPSSLAFFALPGMSIAWHAFRSSQIWQQRLLMLLKRSDFLVLPFIQFSIFRLFFFKPHPVLAGDYHNLGIRTSRFSEAMDRIQTDFLMDMPWAIRILLLAVPILLMVRLVKPPATQQGKAIQFSDVCLLIGCSASFFALLPYIAVGKLPLFSDWNSRYQLFLPLGFSLVSYGICGYVAVYTRRNWLGLGSFLIIFSLSMWFSITSYIEYADDWRKQQQLMAQMRKLTFIKPSYSVVFVDTVKYAKRRQVRQDEYSQMMMRAQPAWHATALSESQLLKVGNGSLEKYFEKLGGALAIQADPSMFGFPDKWRWNDECVVLRVDEQDGRVQIRLISGSATVLQPCVVAP